MKKRFLTLLLSALLLTNATACNVAESGTITTPSEGDDGNIIGDPFDCYQSVLETYRLIVDKYSIVNQNPHAVAKEIGILGEDETQTFVRLYSSVHQLYPSREYGDSDSPHYKLGCGYDTKDINGDGVDELVLLNDNYDIFAIFSYSKGKLVLLDSYEPDRCCWIDGDGLLHVDIYRAHQLYEIEKGGASLRLLVEYGLDYFEISIVPPDRPHYYKWENGEKVSVTLDEYCALEDQYGRYRYTGGTTATKIYSGLTFNPIYTEAEIAMEMYEAALNNEIKVYETDSEQFLFLAKCKTPYDRIPLSDCEQLKYAYTDMDNDSINELVIDCGDTLILRYYEGIVYLYPFTFRQLYYLNIDGSYYWNHTGENFEYGKKQIYFEGADLKTKELYRIVNDGAPNAEYYVDGKQVTHEEITKYFDDNPKTRVEFTAFEEDWEKMILPEDALRKAAEYWNTEEGRYDNAMGTKIVDRIVLSSEPTAELLYYKVTLKQEYYYNHPVEGYEDYENKPHAVMECDTVFVNAFTGRCQKYVITLNEALKIAQQHCKAEENGYEVIPVDKKVSGYSIYVFLVRTAPYHNVDEIWVDKYTGECLAVSAKG